MSKRTSSRKPQKNIHTFLRENGFEIDSRWRRLPAPYCAAVKKYTSDSYFYLLAINPTACSWMRYPSLEIIRQEQYASKEELLDILNNEVSPVLGCWAECPSIKPLP